MKLMSLQIIAENVTRSNRHRWKNVRTILVSIFPVIKQIKYFIFAGNPSDVKWLKTALHKGTSKDRANAGALLVQSNPIANLETLESLISFTKITNKNCTDSVGKDQIAIYGWL